MWVVYPGCHGEVVVRRSSVRELLCRHGDDADDDDADDDDGTVGFAVLLQVLLVPL